MEDDAYVTALVTYHGIKLSEIELCTGWTGFIGMNGQLCNNPIVVPSKDDNQTYLFKIRLIDLRAIGESIAKHDFNGMLPKLYYMCMDKGILYLPANSGSGMG